MYSFPPILEYEHISILVALKGCQLTPSTPQVQTYEIQDGLGYY